MNVTDLSSKIRGRINVSMIVLTKKQNIIIFLNVEFVADEGMKLENKIKPAAVRSRDDGYVL